MLNARSASVYDKEQTRGALLQLNVSMARLMVGAVNGFYAVACSNSALQAKEAFDKRTICRGLCRFLDRGDYTYGEGS